MRVERHQDASSFLAQAGEFLREREAEHNLILGLAGRLRSMPEAYSEEPPYFAVALDGERIIGATMRTPPHNLILSEIDDDAALEALAGNAGELYKSLPGAIGPREPVGAFARIWERQTGAGGRVSMKERIYRAQEVRMPDGVPGTMRLYEDRDRELVLAWLEAFAAEAMPEAPPDDATDWLERRQTDPDSGLVLWDDGQPATLGGFGGVTPNGIRIGPIYTPPDLRRCGYASALTAELTQMLLDRGRRFCFLYTDLANPTSNSIYQRIGYEPVADVDMWAFS